MTLLFEEDGSAVATMGGNPPVPTTNVGNFIVNTGTWSRVGGRFKNATGNNIFLNVGVGFQHLNCELDFAGGEGSTSHEPTFGIALNDDSFSIAGLNGYQVDFRPARGTDHVRLRKTTNNSTSNLVVKQKTQATPGTLVFSGNMTLDWVFDAGGHTVTISDGTNTLVLTDTDIAHAAGTYIGISSTTTPTFDNWTSDDMEEEEPPPESVEEASTWFI